MTLAVMSSAQALECHNKPGSASSRPSSAGNRRTEWVSSTENTSDHNDEKHKSTRTYFSAPSRIPARGAYGAHGARMRAMSNPQIGQTSGCDASVAKFSDENSKLATPIVAWSTETHSALHELAPHLDFKFERLRTDLCFHCQELAATVTAEFERQNRRQIQKQQLTPDHSVPNMVTELALKLLPHLEKSFEAQEERTLNALVQQWYASGAELAETWSQKAKDAVNIEAHQQHNEIVQAISDAESRHTKLFESLQRNFFVHQMKSNEVNETVRLEFETLSAKCAASIQAAAGEGQSRLLQSGLREVESLIRGLMSSNGDAVTALLKSDMKRVVQEELHQHREQSSRQVEAAVGEAERRHARLMEALGKEINLSIKGMEQLIASTNDAATSGVRSEMKRCVQDVLDQQGDHRSRQVETAVAEAERRHSRLMETLSREVGVLVKQEVDRHTERLAEKLQQESQTWQYKFWEVKALLDDVNQRTGDIIRSEGNFRENLFSDADKRHGQILQSVQDIGARLKAQEEWRRENVQRHEEVLSTKMQLNANSDSNQQIAQSVDELAQAVAGLHAKANQNWDEVHETRKCIMELSAAHADNDQESNQELVLQKLRALESRVGNNEASRKESEEARHKDLSIKFNALDVRIGGQEEAMRTEGSQYDQVLRALAALEAHSQTHAEAIQNFAFIERHEAILEAIRKLDSSILDSSCRAEKSVAEFSRKDSGEARHAEILMKLNALDERIGGQEEAMRTEGSQHDQVLRAIQMIDFGESREAILEAIGELDSSITDSGVTEKSTAAAIAAVDIRLGAMFEKIQRIDFNEGSQVALEAIRKLESAVTNLRERADAHSDMLEAIKQMAITKDNQMVSQTTQKLESSVAALCSTCKELQLDFNKGNESVLETIQKLDATCDHTDVVCAIEKRDAELSAGIRKIESQLGKVDTEDLQKIIEQLGSFVEKRIQDCIDVLSAKIMNHGTKNSSDQADLSDMRVSITTLSKAMVENVENQDATSQNITKLVNETRDALRKIKSEMVNSKMLDTRLRDIIIEERWPLMEELNKIITFCASVHEWLESSRNSMEQWGMQHMHNDMVAVTSWLESVHKVLKEAADGQKVQALP